MGLGETELDARLADMVRGHRHRAGLTQRELAAKAGLSLAALRDLEQGRRCRPRRGSLAALADALSLDPRQAADLASAAKAPPRRRPGAREPVSPDTGSPGESDAPGSGEGLRLAVLGPLEAWMDGTPLYLGPPGQRVVLGLLAAEPGVSVSRDTVIDVLWGQEPPSTAVSLVQSYVSRLRKLLAPPGKRPAAGEGVIVSAGGGYRLQLSSSQLDLLAFRDLVAMAEASRTAGNDLTACDLYERALELRRGDPLAGLDVLRHQPAVTRLSRQLANGLLRYAELACGQGLHDRVLPRLHALAVAEPLNERVHARLMIALAGAGQQAAAVRVYEDLRDRLDREFAIYPSGELSEAHLRVLRQDIPMASPKRADRHRPLRTEVPRQLPASVRYFTGRDRERTVLSDLLARASQEPGEVPVAALTGMAGIGKTALAVNWAHQVADHFPHGQLFVNLRGFCPSGVPVTSSEALYGFLIALGVPAERVPPDTDRRAALYRSELASRRMLIVLDNACDAEQVRPLLPGSPGCMVLVTSRNRLTGLAAADGAFLLTLGVLGKGESYSLLAKILGSDRVITEPAAVGELIELCARLPLALCDAAARAAALPRLPLATLTAEMGDERGRLDALETGEPATSVRVVFSWSRARLSETAARMFRMLGMHPGPDVTVAAAASLAGLDPAKAYFAMTELCDENLLSEHLPGRYACHALLRAYAAEAARAHASEAERCAAAYRLLDHYLYTASTASALLYPYLVQRATGPVRPGVVPEQIGSARQAAEWLERERHVLLAMISQAAEGGYDPHAWELPWSVGWYLRGEECWHKLADAQEAALATANRLGDLTGQALARHHLCWLRFWLGDNRAAYRHLDAAIDLTGRLGEEPSSAQPSLERAKVLRAQDRLPEALVCAGKALQLYRREMQWSAG